MSWDNNNLACILVFPPWQRKGLGSLLMGVSYEISRRERVLGGPEKPISELGRRGYKRFWAGEIARWLLELELEPEVEPGAEAEGEDVEGEEEGNDEGEDQRKRRRRRRRGKAETDTDDPDAVVREDDDDHNGGGDDEEDDAEDDEDEDEDEGESEDDTSGSSTGSSSVHSAVNKQPTRDADGTLVVDIQTCSRATWIVPEDCLAVLREMGVVEEAGGYPPTTVPATTTTTTTLDHHPNGSIPGESADGEEGEEHAGPTSPSAKDRAGVAARVRIDKAAVRRWVRDHGVDLERTCDPAGFVEGYALKKQNKKKQKKSLRRKMEREERRPVFNK